MKKLLSILMSAMLCASVVLTDVGSLNQANGSEDTVVPGIDWNIDLEGESDNTANPCDSSEPPSGERI